VVKYREGNFKTQGCGMLQGTNCASGTITNKITRRTFQSGLIIETGGSDDHVIKIFCPLIITDKKLKRGLDIIEEALDTVCGRNDEYPASTSNRDTKSFEIDLITLFVCNGRCNGGGMRWAPNAELSNGLLELTLLSGKKKLPLVTSSSKIYKGRISEVPGAIEIQAREVTVKFHQGLRLDADGEILSPIKEEIKEDSIRFSVCERKFPLVM